MKPFGIRARVLMAAILPVITTAVLLWAIFVSVELRDLDSAHGQRALAMARQLAATAEFALFTGNQPALQALVNSAAREEDVVAIAITTRDGAAMARSRELHIDPRPLPGAGDGAKEITDKLTRVIVQPILASEVPLEDFVVSSRGPATAESRLLGYVLLELNRENLAERERALIVGGLLTTLIGLVFGCLLALRLGRSVTRPIVQLSEVVERFGRGELSARVPASKRSPVHDLEEGINRMAARIEQDRDELERRINEATSELRLKKDEAEMANAAKTRFLAVASHDLRQPMHALTLLMENLRDEIAGESRASHLLERAQSAVTTMCTMFDALLDISKLDAGIIETSVQDFPVQALFSRLETMFAPLAIEQGMRFSVVASKVWLRSDPALLERLLQNLVSNAMKYTHAGGVVVGCRRQGAAISIQVWDTGVGIAPENQQLIFQEFFQVRLAGGENVQGLGLGLAIVERLSRLLAHPIRVRSIPGRGSMFAVEVPRAATAGTVIEAQSTLPRGMDFSGLSIAVVDDDAEILTAMHDLLQHWGCTVISVPSRAALMARLAQGAHPDLLICDHQLGSGRNGIAVIDEVRSALGKPVPALLLTGDTSPDRLQEAHDSGLELLHKPVPPARLRQVMQRLLASRRR